MSQVDMERMLDHGGKATEKLNWKASIVDLMKLLGLDGSLAWRKELAQELHRTGDTHDSASMNIWLHREVMKKVTANGGKVLADLQDWRDFSAYQQAAQVHAGGAAIMRRLRSVAGRR